MAQHTDGAGAQRALYLENPSVGDRFTSEGHEIDAEQINAFAKLFDPQSFHLDEEAAKGTFFGGLAASSWHTAAITMRLLVNSGIPLADGIIGCLPALRPRVSPLSHRPREALWFVRLRDSRDRAGVQSP